MSGDAASFCCPVYHMHADGLFGAKCRISGALVHPIGQEWVVSVLRRRAVTRCAEGVCRKGAAGADDGNNSMNLHQLLSSQPAAQECRQSVQANARATLSPMLEAVDSDQEAISAHCNSCLA